MTIVNRNNTNIHIYYSVILTRLLEQWSLHLREKLNEIGLKTQKRFENMLLAFMESAMFYLYPVSLKICAPFISF